MTILIAGSCKIITNYGSFITNYISGLLQITTALLQITAKNYYKLRQKILQFTAALTFAKFKIITNYVKFYRYLRQLLVLLQITENFITNYGRYYKLRSYYKLRRNNSILFNRISMD